MSWKLAPALAAGNTTVIKPSELTPLTTIALVALLEEAGAAGRRGEPAARRGRHVGAAMVAHPGVDLISFTGGLATGEKIMAAAAKGVRRVALELGGKNPNVVFADADFDTAVDYALTAAFLHSGQVCSAGARLIVQDGIHDRFVAELAARADRIRLGSGLDPADRERAARLGAHRAKVERYIERAVEEGARLPAGGKRPEGPGVRTRVLPAPDRVRRLHPRHDRRPGRGVRPGRDRGAVRHEEEAIAARPTTPSTASPAPCGPRTRAAPSGSPAALRHGTVWINDYHPYLPQAEWGGFGKSGIGRELGPSGLEEYQENKHIYHNIDPVPQHWFKG